MCHIVMHLVDGARNLKLGAMWEQGQGHRGQLPPALSSTAHVERTRQVFFHLSSLHLCSSKSPDTEYSIFLIIVIMCHILMHLGDVSCSSITARSSVLFISLRQ